MSNSCVLLEMNELDDRFEFTSSICSALSYAKDEIYRLDETINSIQGLKPECDKFDYIVAAASGVLCGVIDAIFVGELNLAECQKWGSEKVEKFVKKVSGENDIAKAIKKLEQKTGGKFPSDSNLNDFGGGLQHHLRDFAHHPSIMGLAFSILTQFTGNCYGTDTKGKFIVVPVKDKARIGNTIPKKFAYATVYWFLHLVSDMAGSSSHVGKGTGIPGPILSLAKELSVLPPFSLIKVKNNGDDLTVSQLISKLFNGTLFAERDETGKIIKESVVGLDLRTELGIIRKQMFPVLLNEAIVRSFYSIRRLVMELKVHKIERFKDILALDWKKIAPFGNPTVKRMLTVAHGTFCLVDIGDATIHGFAAGAGSFNIKEFVLRINIVGVGRFCVSLYGEAKRAHEYRVAERNSKFAQREKVIVEDYIEGLKMLSAAYNDKELLLFTEEIKDSQAYKKAFEKSVELARLRGVPEEKILKNKAEGDAYFNGGNKR